MLIPTSETGTFSCKTRCAHCHGYWIIDGIPSQRGLRGRSELENQGFTFSDSYSNESNQHAMMVTVNACDSVNGSRISCRYCSIMDVDHAKFCVQSDNAILLVIANE